MTETMPMVEYGVPIDAKTMIEPPDMAELELEPGHPGLGDAGYVQRRKELFALCRGQRLADHGPPLIRLHRGRNARFGGLSAPSWMSCINNMPAGCISTPNVLWASAKQRFRNYGMLSD